MAGADSHGNEENSEKAAAKKRQRLLKTFSCAACGSPISLRNPDSLSVACSHCKAIIDCSNENYRVLQTYAVHAQHHKPVLALGDRGVLFGKKWEFIGFIVRKDESSGFIWDEYLLFNPYYGYRWLTVAQGHWNFVTPLKEKPALHKYANRATFRGKKFRLFDRGVASNVFVLGEFYWRVRQGNSVGMDDYICPPEMLSMENDVSEVNWSLGQYIEESEILRAFNKKDKRTSLRVGIGPNQPSKHTMLSNAIFPWWMFFLVLLTALQIWQLVGSGNQLAYSNTYWFLPNIKSPASTTTKVFQLEKDRANVAIRILAPVSNSWFYMSGELVNNDTGVSFPFDRSVEYYFGYDSDGSWTEGSTAGTVLIPSVPAGKYYIDYEYESGSFPPGSRTPLGVNIEVRRGVATFSDYWWSLLLLSCFPLYFMVRSFTDEQNRWYNSDFSPYVRYDWSED